MKNNKAAQELIDWHMWAARVVNNCEQFLTGADTQRKEDLEDKAIAAGVDLRTLRDELGIIYGEPDLEYIEFRNFRINQEDMKFI